MSHSYVEIKQESVNYLGYYSSHEQLMQQLILDRASIARKKIRDMVAQGITSYYLYLVLSSLIFKELN